MDQDGGYTWKKMGKNMNNLAWQPTNLHMYVCLYGGRVIHYQEKLTAGSRVRGYLMQSRVHQLHTTHY